MTSKARAKPLLRGIVKVVPSGDTLVIMEMGNKVSEIPTERTIILSSLMAPRLLRDFEKDRGEFSPYLKILKFFENEAMNQGVGLWSKAAGTVRNLPPSAVDDPEKLDVVAFLDVNKGRYMEAIVEYLPNGSTLLVYLLPDYQHVRVFIAGVQALPMRNWNAEPEKAEANEKTSNGSHGPLT